MPPSDAELDKMFEDSKDDRHSWVGSDVRMLVAEIRRLRNRDENFTKSVDAIRATLEGATQSGNTRLVGLAANDSVERLGALSRSNY